MDSRQKLLLLAIIWFVFAFLSSAASHEHVSERKLASRNPGFISIDCGASEDYVDEETGIFYESDAKYIDTGEVNETTVEPPFPFYQRQGTKCRSFPQGTRHCYTLKPEKGPNNKYLVRAVFWYSDPNQNDQTVGPVFDLHLGVNKWSTVIGIYQLREAIYVPSTDYVDVCLVRTGQGVPYISAVELRPLPPDNSAYQIEAGALNTLGRFDFGGSNEIVRYPDDLCDRIWRGNDVDPPNTTRIAADSNINLQSISTSAYSVPPLILRTAAGTQNATFPFNFPMGNYFSPSTVLPRIYLYFHFMEFEKRGQGVERELYIKFKNERVIMDNFRLEYLKPLTIAPNDPPINISLLQSSFNESEVSIYAAEGSPLAPLVNAIEGYELIDLPLAPTELGDVKAAMEIKQTYGVTKNWQGDPCVPSDLSWDGLNCSSDSSPRIISLNLSSSKLTGAIADSISNLKALRSLDLSYNNLTGEVPEDIAQLPNLKILKLTGNNLQTSVPDALIQKCKAGTLLLSMDGNPDLCESLPNQKQRKKNQIVVVISSVIAALFFLLVLSLFLVCYLAVYIRKMRDIIAKAKEKQSLKSKNRPFTYGEIIAITDNFRTVIGQGGFGKVYLGIMDDNDMQVAVKVLSPSSKQGYKEFRAEAQLLMIVHHRNLVSLIGYCDEGENMALIYEYMANGNLKEHLSVQNTDILSWMERLQIAVDAAHGLEYLHNGCKPPIIHRDLKTSNILLSEHMQAKLTDFGLSRAFTDENDSHMTTSPAGTLGYLDPQFQASGSYNKKSDIYSFGIILLELITGRPALMRAHGNNTYILQWFSHTIRSGDIAEILDPRLEGKFDTSSAWKAVEIAMSCVTETANQRPDMSLVLAELKECLAIEMASRRADRLPNNVGRTGNSLEIISVDHESRTLVPNPR